MSSHCEEGVGGGDGVGGEVGRLLDARQRITSGKRVGTGRSPVV